MSDDPKSDIFAPPEISTEVCCLHCGETYDSWQIEWRLFTGEDGQEQGFWCCPIDGCDGKGFGFDILPTDPHYVDDNLSCVFDEDDDENDLDDEAELLQQEEFEEFFHDLEWSDPSAVDDDDDDPPPPRPAGDFPFSLN